MKRLIFIPCIFVIVIVWMLQIGFAQTESATVDRIRASIADAKSRYAPDGRTKVIALLPENNTDHTFVIETTEPDAKTYLEEATRDMPAKVKIVLLPDSSVGDKTQGIVNLSVSNLRSAPGHSSEMATQLLLGTQVDILQKRRSEYRVRTPEGYIAYVPTSSIVAMDSEALQNWKNHKKIIYTEEFGKSYSTPSPTSLRVSDLVYGNILLLDNTGADYLEVSYPDQRKAYIKTGEAIEFEKWVDTRQASAENILASAKSMLGLPYLWGGTSVKGVDCSGLTKTSFYMNGYVIPRDASQQVLAGDEVQVLDDEGTFDHGLALKNLRPADLLFFAGGSSSRITHVALYLGEGEFIHAAGTVRINSMLPEAANYDDFQTRTLVAARRYLGSEDPQIHAVQQHPYYN